MSMYNLLQCRDSYSMTSGSLQNYYRDEVNDDANENNDNYYKLDNEKATTTKFIEWRTRIIGSTPAGNNTLDKKVAVPLNYWETLNLMEQIDSLKT